ncbi:MAG: ROK family protein [Planctomycetia bacterium]|nr:ROK family protein [Planctomycetia bacterium]
MSAKRNRTRNGTAEQQPTEVKPRNILAIDIGGTKVKLLLSGQAEPRKAPSGKRFTPAALVATVRELAADWQFDGVSIGYPGLVGNHGPRCEPGNLAPGWVGFDYAAAFGCPVRIANDAAMQALGSYDSGRMLFVGLGTGLGSALIADHVIVTLELGQMPAHQGPTLGEVLGRTGFKKLGKKRWRDAVNRVLPSLMKAFVADYVVVGGGNSKELKQLPHGVRMGHNLTAFRGGFRLWNVEDVPTLAADGEHSVPAPPPPVEWRVL